MDGRRRVSEERLRIAWVLVAFVACGGDKGAPDAARAADASAIDASSDAAIDDASASAQPKWVELVREERWSAAGAAIDALPDADRKKPEVRFARASVAFAHGDAKTTVTALESLETELPALAAEVARLRARAQAIAGPYDVAGEWLVKHATTNDDHIAAASAFMRAKLPSRANAECAHVINAEHKSHAQEAEARAIRLHTGEPADVIADARWLLVHGDVANAKDAESILAKEDPKHPLTQHELLARAQTLADAAQLEESIRALDRAMTAPQPTSMTALRRARADVFMRARVRYIEAALIFKQISNDAKNPQAASDLEWSARALSRADHDDEAIDRYADVVARFGKTPEAAAATFYSARLELLHGRWEKAAARFDEYAAKYGSGADREEAMHLRAIAHFERGDDVKRARTLLEQRAGSEHDPVARARMSNLAAQAALKDGDKTHAIARFTEVAKSLPLSWPALVARARLGQLGAPLPPMATSPESPQPPLTVNLPEAVATLDRIGLASAAEEALRARESEVTSAAPARSVEALCIAYGKIDRAKRRLQLSSQISAADLQNAPSASTRWAWQCAYPSPFAAQVLAAEIKETLPAGLLYAVMRQESSFDTDAVSPARAIGVLQLLPETAQTVARDMGIRLEDGDLHSPSRSIDLGARYLHDLVVKSHGSLPLAIASYNAGAESVLRWAQRMKGMELDAFVEAIPFFETRGYVVKVMENLARYGFLEHGEEGIPKIDLGLQMNRALFALIAFLFALVLAPSALAYTPPPMTAHVTDTAGKLTEPERLAIDRKLEDYRARTSNEIAVFIPATLDGNTPEEVAFAAGRTWKIGVKGKDNGIVLLIAPVERKAFIAVGKGAEGSLTDLQSNDIVRQKIRPRLTPGSENYHAAVDDATDAIISALDAGGGGVPAPSKSAPHTSSLDVVFALVFLLIIIGIPILFVIIIARAIGSAFSSNGQSANRGWASGGTWSSPSDSSWSSSSSDSSWSSGGGGDSGFSGGGDSGFSGGGGDFGGGGGGDSF